MFERFTREARQAVTSGVAEAERRGDPMVGAEHLLVGLACSNADFGSGFLAGFGVSLDILRSSLVQRDAAALASVGIETGLAAMSSEAPGWRSGHLRFTKAAKEALEQALEEATALKHRRIGPEHLLLALTRRGPEDEAIRLLRMLDVHPHALRTATLDALRVHGG